jgi:hypothetical protein
MKVCKTPEAQFHITIGTHMISCSVEIPFKLSLTATEAIALEDKIHDAIEEVLSEYWQREEEIILNFDETFKEMLERQLQENRQ